MELRRLVYLSRTQLPNQRSHSIQMLRTCRAIAGTGLRVDFLVRGELPLDPKAVLDYYGLPAVDTLAVRALPPADWEHLSFVRSMFRAVRGSRAGTAFLTRDPHLARRLARLRPVLRVPVFYETHMRDGFFERQYLPYWMGEVSAGRAPDPRTTHWYHMVDYCYRRVDGVISQCHDTMHVLKRSYPATPAIYVWHGTDPSPVADYDAEQREGIYYVGNLYELYRFETLLEAVARLPNQPLYVVGGNDQSDVERTQGHADRLGIGSRVHFLGHVPPWRVGEFCQRARVGVALLEGAKLADYFSAGLPVVAPDLPNVREVIRDGKTGALFKVGDSGSLASALRRVLTDPAFASRLATSAREEALKYTWARRASRIIGFISDATRSKRARR